MNVSHCLFDFDGTLVDSMPVYISSVLSILDRYQIRYGEDTVKIITPLGTLKTAEYFIGLGVPLTVPEILIQMKELMLEAYCHRIPAKESVPETLVELKRRGIRLHVLTASPHVTLDPCLERLGLFSLFDHVWSCDDFGTSKADPDIYRKAAERLGTTVEDVLFLDDNPNACRTAFLTGMKVCGVYDDSSAEYEKEMREASHAYIRFFSELPALIKNK